MSPEICCAKCGYFGKRNNKTTNIEEAIEQDRTEAKFNRDHTHFPLPICFRGVVSDFREEVNAGDQPGVLQVIQKDRSATCAAFFEKLRVGFSPKEHLDIANLKAARDAADKQQRDTREWQAKQRLEDQERQDRMRREDQARQDKQRRNDKAWGVVVAVVSGMIGYYLGNQNKLAEPAKPLLTQPSIPQPTPPTVK
jgi:hypothetical protein